MPPKEPRQKKAGPRHTVTITVNGRTLPFVGVHDLTIDDQVAIRAATSTTWRVFYPADQATQMDAGIVAVWWWMARRHAGEKVAFEAAAADVETLEEFTLNVETPEVDDPES